jgi:hypothetical protein
MIAVPWYLLAAGIALVILGHFIENLSGSAPVKTKKTIDHKMRDKDIINSLNEREEISTGSMIALLGYGLVAISVFWRLAQYFI